MSEELFRAGCARIHAWGDLSASGSLTARNPGVYSGSIETKDLFKHLKVYRSRYEDVLRDLHAEHDHIVQKIADETKSDSATGHMGDSWQVSKAGADNWRSLWDLGDRPKPEAFRVLELLEKELEDVPVGPSNLEMFRARP